MTVDELRAKVAAENRQPTREELEALDRPGEGVCLGTDDLRDLVRAVTHFGNEAANNGAFADAARLFKLGLRLLLSMHGHPLDVAILRTMIRGAEECADLQRAEHEKTN